MKRNAVGKVYAETHDGYRLSVLPHIEKRIEKTAVGREDVVFAKSGFRKSWT